MVDAIKRAYLLVSEKSGHFCSDALLLAAPATLGEIAFFLMRSLARLYGHSSVNYQSH